MRILILLLSSIFISCSAVKPVKVSYSGHEIMMRDYIFDLEIARKSKENRFKIHLEPLRPQPEDFIIYETDLNNDGKLDFIASINHFLFSDNGTYPLYIMIADEYGGYTPMPDLPRIKFFDVSISDGSSPYPELTIACKIYRYNGFSYKEIQE